MKRNRCLIFYSFLFFVATIIAQNKPIDSIASALQKDQLFFEKVFIHTNKSNYTKEDVVWFKAYVSSNENKPSLKTTLLYVSLFSEDGELIKTQNVFINEGVGIGQFELFGSVKNGDYYIQACTNFMKNFGEANVFVSKISIGNPGDKIVSKNDLFYDVQLFPEGGNLLENVENVIAVKVLMNGKGFPFLGKIIDSKKRVVAHFKDEYLGMAKCKFLYNKLENYQAIISVNDTVLKKAVPLAKQEGIALKVSSDLEFVSIQLQANKQTSKKTNDYYILFHQNNKLVNYADVIIEDTSKIELKINKKNFYRGVNTVTVFKNKIPILERKFFIYKENNTIDVKIEKLLKNKDSITFKLKTIGSSSKANLSASMLSSALRLDQTNIEAALLLTPYLKGYIEQPSYYFNKRNKERFKHLDLLLLTQGWAQYNAPEFINNINPKYKHNFEVGFKLTGVNKMLVSNNLALISKDNKVIDEIFLNSKLDFVFKNLLIYKGDSVKLSFVKPNKELSKPIGIHFDALEKHNFKLKPIVLNLDYSLTSTIEEKEYLGYGKGSSTRLDTVNISGKRISKRSTEKKRLVSKYKKTTFDIGKYMPLEVNDRYEKEFLMHYLERAEGVKLVSWKGLEWYLEVGEGKEASLFVDGRIMKSEDLGGLKLKMKDIEAVMVQPYPEEGGVVRYQVFTTENYKKGITELYKEYVFEYGYSKAKKYYTPIKDFNFKNEIQEVDWKPMLKTNTTGETEFKVKQSALGCVISIQGFTKDGELINSTFIAE